MNPTEAQSGVDVRAESLPAAARVFSTAPPFTRDRALDVLRGFAIVAMLSTHVGPMSRVTAVVHLPLWVSAIDFFVLTSGFVIGMKSARELTRRPARDLYLWLVRRAGMLYGIHCALTLLVLLVHAATGRLDAPDAASVGGVAKAILLVLALRLQPGDFMNILPLYIVFLAATPLVVEASRRKMSLVLLAASAFVWLLAQRDPNLVPLPDPAVSAVPFSLAAWQFVFVVGLLAGVHRERLVRALSALGFLLPAAIVTVTTALFVLAQLERDAFRPSDYETPAALHSLLGKQTFAPIHALYAIGLTAIGYFAIDRWFSVSERAERSWSIGFVNEGLGALARLGRKSLYSFQVHLIFALAASAAGARAWPSWGQDLLVVAAILLLHEFVRREVWMRQIPN